MATTFVNSGAAQPTIEVLWKNATNTFAKDGVVTFKKSLAPYDFILIEYMWTGDLSSNNDTWGATRMDASTGGAIFINNTGAGRRCATCAPRMGGQVRLSQGWGYNCSRMLHLTNTTLTSDSANSYYNKSTTNFTAEMCVPLRIFGVKGVIEL